jgi:hypothetical protein
MIKLRRAPFSSTSFYPRHVDLPACGNKQIHRQRGMHELPGQFDQI